MTTPSGASSRAPRRTVVTGGGGFLGLAIVSALRQRGDQVLSISRGSYSSVAALGAQQAQADLADSDVNLAELLAGSDVVFHCAAKAGVWGPAAEFERANVLATQNVLDACLAAGVPRLVLTSSPSVCFDGNDHLDAGNELPLATNFLAPYPRTKAEAERRVLAAHGKQGTAGPLSTCALRPHLIYGPGDPHLVPRVLERARQGKLRIVGTGDNQVSLTHVNNAAAAHLNAAECLAPGADCGGQAYFICDESPVRLWDWVNQLLGRAGIAAVTRRVPFRLAYALGAALESAWRLTGRPGEPPMTRFVAAQLATSHTYSTAPARRDLGYAPRDPGDLPDFLPDAIAKA